jgi:hypothetical protein
MGQCFIKESVTKTAHRILYYRGMLKFVHAKCKMMIDVRVCFDHSDKIAMIEPNGLGSHAHENC